MKTESQQKLMQSSPQLTKSGKSNNNLNSSYASRYTLYKLSQDPKAVSRSRVAQSMRQTKYKLKTKPIEQRYSILRDSANIQTAESKELKHELMLDESSVMLADPQVDLSFEDIERMNDSQARQVRRQQIAMIKLPKLRGSHEPNTKLQTQESFLRIVDEKGAKSATPAPERVIEEVKVDDPLITQKCNDTIHKHYENVYQD